jgi:hypothetical protein
MRAFGARQARAWCVGFCAKRVLGAPSARSRAKRPDSISGPQDLQISGYPDLQICGSPNRRCAGPGPFVLNLFTSTAYGRPSTALRPSGDPEIRRFPGSPDLQISGTRISGSPHLWTTDVGSKCISAFQGEFFCRGALQKLALKVQDELFCRGVLQKLALKFQGKLFCRGVLQKLALKFQGEIFCEGVL